MAELAGCFMAAWVSFSCRFFRRMTGDPTSPPIRW